MPSLLFTVSQAAAQLGVSGSSVRRIYDDYVATADSPRAGSSRRLSAQDIEVIREVIKLKAEGLSPEKIREQLESLVFSAPIVESPQAAQDRAGAHEGAIVVVEALRSVEARLQALEARVQPLEHQRLRVDVIFLVVTGFIAGLVVGLAVWWFQ